MTYDVIVCGGGLAGTAAAISAARCGAKTLLIERYGFLGGAATNGLVNPFMDYKMKSNGELVNGGIFIEIIERLEEMGGLFYGNKSTFNEEYLKVILDEMTAQSGVEVLFHSFVAKVHREDDHICFVEAAGKSGMLTFYSHCFVDATGDADLAAFSNCETEMGNENGYGQPMTLNFRLANVDRSQFAPMFPGRFTKLDGVDSKEITAKVNRIYRDFQQAGKIKNPREDVQTFPCMLPSMIHFNSTRVIKKNAVDVYELTESEQIARQQMMELFLFLKENIPGFSESHLVMSGPQIGIRESRRLVGEYVLTAEDLLSCKKFEDSIARGVYSIDVHNPEGSGTLHKIIPAGDYYTIPYRSMLPKEVKNLIVCGRPISATHEAHSAIRVMSITTCVGQAAGIGAGLCATKKMTFMELPFQEIQKEIMKNNGLY